MKYILLMAATVMIIAIVIAALMQQASALEATHVMTVQTQSGKVVSIPKLNAVECRKALLSNHSSNRQFSLGACTPKIGGMPELFCSKSDCYEYNGGEMQLVDREDA